MGMFTGSANVDQIFPYPNGRFIFELIERSNSDKDLMPN